MIYDWYKIANKTEFLATGLPSRELTLDLEDRGEQDFLVTAGNLVSIVYDDVFIPCQFNEYNPFEFEDYGSYVDENGDIWFGFLNED